LIRRVAVAGLGYGLDLHPAPEGEGGDLDGGAGRRVGLEELTVDLVHAGELVDVLEEDRAFDHVLQARASGLEDGLEVLQGLVSLALDVGSGEVLGSRTNAQLAGGEDEIAQADALGIGADGGRRLAGGDDLLVHMWLLVSCLSVQPRCQTGAGSRVRRGLPTAAALDAGFKISTAL